ncbi:MULTISPECIES: hypothetical protein [Lysobacteraceae]|uniref:hypothetical protein n=1 Tax=Lysobacteraceae TaxID=32033 RepID=UPI00128FD799|nr:MULTISPECIES: hypothetical protein [Xanthomonadaceae]MBH1404085.1 hypothetical protein [Stenotrophomonas maltophilia]UQA24766.1 hypothetical protein M1L61_11540 [Stenotrophomonas sp. NY11291]
MLISLLAGGWLILLVGLGLFHTWKARSHVVAFRWGAVIAGVNLAASLIVPTLLPKGTDALQISFVTNSFLLAAAIGANMMAGAATFNLKR